MDYFEELKKLVSATKEIRGENKEMEAEIRRMKLRETLPELLDFYRKVYKMNYGAFYSPQYQQQLKILQARGIPENVTPSFERSHTLYQALDDLNKLKAKKDFTFKYLVPGEKNAKIWTSNKDEKRD